MKFEIGDRVSVIKYYGTGYPNGNGTVVKIEGTDYVCVEYDNIFGGHNCGGLCKFGHGWSTDINRLKHLKLSWKARLGGKP